MDLIFTISLYRLSRHYLLGNTAVDKEANGMKAEILSLWSVLVLDNISLSIARPSSSQQTR